MSVKTIFAVLIGTVFLLVCGTLFIEAINANVNGNNFSTDLRKSVQMACDYYSQESYRGTSVYGEATMANSTDIKYISSGGVEVVLTDDTGRSLGDFYQGTTPREIFDNLYTLEPARTRFSSAMASVGEASTFNNVTTGDGYDLMISPMNYGVTYMDKDTLERMARWCLCKTLTIKNSDSAQMIRDDWLDDGKVYINSGGFLVDINSFAIDDITYSKYDLTNVTQKEDFERLVGFELGPLNDTDEVIVANINCSVDIKYIGISFLGHLLSMDMGGVDGLDGGHTATNAGGLRSDASNTGAIGSTNTSNAKMRGNIVYYTMN